MGEVIDPTWVAYSSRVPPDARGLDAGAERLARHYAATAEGELASRCWHGDRVGVVCLTDSARTVAWPAHAEDRARIVVSSHAPIGWKRVVAGTGELSSAALELGEVLDRQPARAAADLDAPAVIVVASKIRSELLICNDRLGAGRLYRMEVNGVTAWSNRLGALPLFLGVAARSDIEAWRSFAAMGWFIGSRTPIAGATRVPPATTVRASDGAIEARSTDAIGAVVAPSPRTTVDEWLHEFEAEAAEAAHATIDLFPEAPRVDVSGGRDSRLAAAVFVANDIPARFVTSDMTPGEADVARELFGLLQGRFEHRVVWGGDRVKVYDKGLRERARAVHRIHDGMRHASKVRGKMRLPPRFSAGAEVSGHGGEIAHGFYYSSPRRLRRLTSGGPTALLERLGEAGRRRHHGARVEAYEQARDECAASLARGREVGLSGPALLDWFYLMERFAHRSGLAADAQRITLFSCRGFIGAAFAMDPEERLAARLHQRAIARLVPAWAAVPYFAGKPRMNLRAKLLGRWRQVEKRPMIWEGADGDELDRMIGAAGSWTEIYEPARVEEIWRLSRGGRADPQFQDVLEGIAYREAFDDHLALLGRAARAGPPVAPGRRAAV